MVKAFLVLIISIIFFTIGITFKRSSIKDKKEEETYKETYGIIESVITIDYGDVVYYVSFVEDGKTYMAETYAYSADTKSLNEGDNVKIKYFFTENIFTKKSSPIAIILDERVIRAGNPTPAIRMGIIIGSLLLITAIVMFIKEIVSI